MTLCARVCVGLHACIRNSGGRRLLLHLPRLLGILAPLQVLRQLQHQFPLPKRLFKRSCVCGRLPELPDHDGVVPERLARPGKERTRQQPRLQVFRGQFLQGCGKRPHGVCPLLPVMGSLPWPSWR